MILEDLCTRCEARTRLSGSRSTWCRECKNEWQRSYRAGLKLKKDRASPVPDGDCLIWQAYTYPNGYGYQRVNGVAKYAHRVAYEDAHGPIPEGLVLDHLCRRRNCVNPDHLEPVTNAENLRRGRLARGVA